MRRSDRRRHHRIRELDSSSPIVRLLMNAQDWLFDAVILPALYQLGLMEWADYVYDALWFVLLGLVAVAVAYLGFSPLGRLWPVETQTGPRRRRAAMLFTLLARLGVIPPIF